MAHHGWVGVSGRAIPAALLSPFGRLFPARTLNYDSHAISLLAGAHGPLEERVVRDKNDKPLRTEDGALVTKAFFAPPACTAEQADGTNIGPATPPPEKKGLKTGFTFLGQFIDHDMTEFRVVARDLAVVQQNPTIGQRQRVHEDGDPTATNGRSGRLDLDSVYGLLSGVDLALFDGGGRFLLSKDERDILRFQDYRDGRLIADPRNDENLLIVQLHVLFQRLHNKLHRPVKAGATERERKAAISETRRTVMNVYRRIVLFDYLPRVAGEANVQDVWDATKRNRSFFQRMNRRLRSAVLPLIEELADGIPTNDGLPSKAPEVVQQFLNALVAVPVEFSHAVFRLGHTQLRDSYVLKPGAVVPLFRTGLNAELGSFDLRGNQEVTPDKQLEWSLFFGKDAAEGRPLDANLPPSIFRLPPPSIGEPPISLAERNIRRGVDFGLPSGQEAARILGTLYDDVPILTADQVLPPAVLDVFKELRELDSGLAVATPLWFYVLREAAETVPTEPHLGRTGGLIVAETILGALAASDEFDLGRYLNETNGRCYADRVQEAGETGVVEDVDDIRTMVQLLNYMDLAVEPD